jgi:tryptophan synthase alpha chain
VNRIVGRFQRLRAARDKGLIAYIGAGDPDLEATRQFAMAFEEAGVDVLELGVPFSDPLADGLVNQLAAQRGLASGTTPSGVLETVAAIRRDSSIPIVLYVYYNLVHRHGLERFIAEAAASGVDGLLILDLPPEEAEAYQKRMREAGLCAIWLVAPTTPVTRIARIVALGSGFIYYVSREGVTGMQNSLSDTIENKVAEIRTHTDLPVAIGFGVSNPEQAKTAVGFGDAVVVGSAIVNRIAQLGGSPSLVPEVTSFVRSLAEAVHQPAFFSSREAVPANSYSRRI